MKKGIIVILAIMITGGAVFAAPIIMKFGSNGSNKDKAGVATTEINTPITVSNGNATDNVVNESPLVTPSTEYKSDVAIGSFTPTLAPKATAKKNVGTTTEPVYAEETFNTAGPSYEPASTAGINTPVTVIADNETNYIVEETPLVPMSTKYKSDITIGVPTPSVVPKTTTENKDKTSTKPVDSKTSSSKHTSTEKDNSQSGSWIDKKIREHKDEIDADDIDDIKRIYSSVNVSYIQGLMDGGLDDEETEKLKEYLKSKLGGDYGRAKELFYEYSDLLS